MFLGIREKFLAARRRKEVEAELDAAHAEIRRHRPVKAYRQRDWQRDAEWLDLLRPWLARAGTVVEIDKQSAAIRQVVDRAKALVANETGVASAIESAREKAESLRQRAASTLRGSAFQQAERRHRAILDECNSARRARDSRSEEASLRRIADGLATLEAAVDQGDRVNAAVPAIEARLAAIKPEDVWIDTGSKETYDDLLATFGETQKDVKRGDYDKAFQRIREIENLEAGLRSRLGRRADWALQEVDMWLACPSVAEAFPELEQFPKTLMPPTDIERLYALRPAIGRFVAERADRQRELNMPSRDVTSERKLAANHPLRMPLEKSANPVDLEEFLRWVTAFGRNR